jgi:hypothetical protein
MIRGRGFGRNTGDLFVHAELFHDLRCTARDYNPSPNSRDGVMRFIQVYVDILICKLPDRDSESKPSYACTTAQEIQSALYF